MSNVVDDLLITTLERERDEALKYKAFACELMNMCTEYGSCGELDGGSLQSLAVEHGLLKVEQRVVPCEDGCVCVEFVDDGETIDCYRHNWDKANALEVKK